MAPRAVLSHLQPIECCAECAAGAGAMRARLAVRQSCFNGNISDNVLASNSTVDLRQTWISSAAQHETKASLHWSDADFETSRSEMTFQQAAHRLQRDSITLLFCFGTWAFRVDTPVYSSLSHSRGGEARMDRKRSLLASAPLAHSLAAMHWAVLCLWKTDRYLA